jgi:hypothetical protein
VVVEALAAGQLSPDDAAAWLTSRLSPARVRRPSRALPLARVPAAARMLISAMLTLAAGGLVLLATACARGPMAPAAPPHAQVTSSSAARPAAKHVMRVSPAVTTRPFG